MKLSITLEGQEALDYLQSQRTALANEADDAKRALDYLQSQRTALANEADDAKRDELQAKRVAKKATQLKPAAAKPAAVDPEVLPPANADPVLTSPEELEAAAKALQERPRAEVAPGAFSLEEGQHIMTRYVQQFGAPAALGAIAEAGKGGSKGGRFLQLTPEEQQRCLQVMAAALQQSA